MFRYSLLRKEEFSEELSGFINNKIFNDFDFDPNVKISKESLKQVDSGDAYGFVLDDIPISTSKIGPMRLIIKSLFVRVSIALSKDLGGKFYFSIEYNFKYNHTGIGSNGYLITYIFDENGNLI